MQRLQVITLMKNINDREKLPEDAMLSLDKPISTHRSILKTNNEDYEEEENAEEDPTCDEYHNMKEKEEDDDGKLKSANKSMQINQRVDLPIHMELEQQPDGSRFQLKQVREAACLTELTTLQLFYDSSFFRAKSLSYRWFLRFLCTNSYYEDDYNEK